MTFKHLVAASSNAVRNVVFFAPTQQFPTTEAAVAANRNLDICPRLPEVFDQQFSDRFGVLGSVDLARPKVRQQRLAAAEHVQRQEAVVPIVSVIETTFLLTVNTIVGRVEVERDFFRRSFVRSNELIDKDVNGVSTVANALTPKRLIFNWRT